MSSGETKTDLPNVGPGKGEERPASPIGRDAEFPEVSDAPSTRMSSAEEILRSFVARMRSEDPRGLERWELTLTLRVEERLAGSPHQRYYSALRKLSEPIFADGDVGHVQALSAAFAYELDHRAEIQETRGNNKRVLFRAATDLFLELQNPETEVVRVALAALPLEELQRELVGNSARTDFLDFQLLTLHAVRRAAQQPELSNTIFVQTGDELIAPLGTHSERLFGGRVLSTAPESLRQICSVLCADAGKRDRIAAYCVRQLSDPAAPMSASEFDAWLGQTGLRANSLAAAPVQQKYEGFEAARLILAASPAALGEEVQRQIPGGISARIDAAQRAHHERLARETVAAAESRERETREWRNRIPSINRMVTDVQIEPERIVRIIQRSIARTGAQNIWKITDGFFHNEDSWKIVGDSLLASNTGFWLPQSIGELDTEIRAACTRAAEFLEPEALAQVRHAWPLRKAELEAQCAELSLSQAEMRRELVRAELERGLRAVPGQEIQELQLLRDRARGYIDELRPQLEGAPTEYFREYLRALGVLVTERLIEIESAVAPFESAERRRAALAEREATQLQLLELQQQQLRNDIERKIEYLTELYELGMSLSLGRFRGSASTEAGTVVGSVLTVASPSLRMSHHAQLRMHLLRGDEIDLEMGEDLQSLRKRLHMVDWVGPHEMAHVVDGALHRTEVVLESQKVEIMGLVTQFAAQHQVLADEILQHNCEESVLDGIGFSMLRRFGTSNPLETSQRERVTAALRGYHAMSDVLEHVIEHSIETPEQQQRYAVALLRTVAQGEMLVDAGRDASVDPGVIESVERSAMQLRRTITKLSAETQFLPAGAANEIVGLFRRGIVAGMLDE